MELLKNSFDKLEYSIEKTDSEILKKICIAYGASVSANAKKFSAKKYGDDILIKISFKSKDFDGSNNAKRFIDECIDYTTEKVNETGGGKIDYIDRNLYISGSIFDHVFFDQTKPSVLSKY